MLYLVSTPIGNLQDITFRAIEALKSCDYILCEDTRHSKILLAHYAISKPIKSFHKFSEAAKEDFIISDLQNGSNICLISDAGTPAISDPGQRLVQRCVEEDIPVCSIPGPCAAIAAISCSGLDTSLFQFVGFLPKKKSELKSSLADIMHYKGTTVCYESPHRLDDLLAAISAIDPNRKVVIARELTKKFEEVLRGTASALLASTSEHSLKGEIVVMIQGKSIHENEWLQLTEEQHVHHLMNTRQLPQREAIKLAAEQRGVPKRNIYNLFHNQKN